MTDPIADFLIRIKNGYLAGKKQIMVPYSKIKEKIAEILVKEKYLKSSKLPARTRHNFKDVGGSVAGGKVKTLELELKYKDKKPVLTDVKRISKPGLRIYAKAGRIPPIKYGLGITIVSTSAGLMTDTQARKKNLGGEVICQVW